MTVKEYCKPLAMIDNSLKLRNESDRKLQTNDVHEFLERESNQSTTYQSERNHGGRNDIPPRISNLTNPTVDDNGIGNSTGSVNHDYPNAWIPVIESSKVPPGTVKRAVILGKDIIVTRSVDEEQVSVFDAYCPHMGSHLGINARVVNVGKESCIECPFHGWTFRSSDGQCVKIPYQRGGSTGAIPKQAKLNAWITDEKDNFIYIWHHAENLPPSWYIESSPEVSELNWHLACRSCHRTNLDLQDMQANGADMNHFDSIHNDLFVLGGNLARILNFKYIQSYFRHHWVPSWAPILDDKGRMTHKALMEVTSWTSFFKFNLFKVTVQAYQIGPTCVKFYYSSKSYGRGLFIMNTIPLGGRRVKYIQHLYVEKTLINALRARLVFYGELKQVSE